MSAPTVIRLEDYKVPTYLIDEVFLHFELQPEFTTVRTVSKVRHNPDAGNSNPPLVLDGEKMVLKSVLIDGVTLNDTQYSVDEHSLTIPNVPHEFTLETIVEIKPHENTALTGLYQSRGNYCTQCESHGFRRITYFLDRPDVMTRFTTTITADKDRYPLLLSNGNLVEEKELDGNRRWVKWEDPSLKPSYLFALVAGDYDCLDDTFTTMSGRKVALKVYVEKGNLDQSHFAMGALKRSMKWDEETFGCEYDLDIYMIVAVSDFNMGAMENKGLNIFNDKYILARPDTATDDDYVNIESVIGHEYFHNWSGNRVTVRDWFQITLKEGLTIFRDQSFTADMTSKAVKRIRDVNVIRSAQFAQDAGPMAHPIRPRSYIEINNFYTVTVYNKGSEVIRMMSTLLGPEKFTQAMKTYFSRFDGRAVTTEDFVDVMEETYGKDLSQFRLWYEQAGTPHLDVTSEYDESEKRFTLQVKQSCSPTPDQPTKAPFFIPFSVGLLSSDGSDMVLDDTGATTKVLLVSENEQSFVFENIEEEPIPSLLRNFSAPVKVNYEYNDDDFVFLMTHDSDNFNRWDAGQQLAIKIIFDLIQDYHAGDELHLDSAFIDAFSDVLSNKDLKKLFIAEMLSLPSPSYLMELMLVADVEAIHHVRQFIKNTIAEELSDQLWDVYHDNQGDDMGERRLKNLALWYLSHSEDSDALQAALQQYQSASNLTDKIGALSALNDIECQERQQVLEQFYHDYQSNHLVLDKWFTIQAMSTLPTALSNVKSLLQHVAFDLKNPNKLRSLVGGFVSGNYLRFHESDGSGYQFLAEQVKNIDAFNPQVAARLIEPLIRWRKFDENRQGLMKQQLEMIANSGGLSKDVYEIVTKSLKD